MKIDPYNKTITIEKYTDCISVYLALSKNLTKEEAKEWKIIDLKEEEYATDWKTTWFDTD